MGRKIVLHLHTDVRDKKPLPGDIMDGELAINCAASGETIYIKNSEEAIAEFKDDKYYQKQLSELATKNELAQKQDIISDIDTIRNNAANYKGTVTGVKINGTTKNPSNGVVDLGTVITSHQDISGKQDKLVSETNIKTINGESVLGSGDITIGGGTSSSAYPEVNHGTGDTTFTLTPNTFHVWDEVTSLTLNFGSGISGVANEYLFQFTSGPTATSLTLPDDIKWANDNVPTINRNMIYQVSVLRGLASVLEFNNTPPLVENKATVSISGTKYLVSLQYAAASDIVVKVRTVDGPISVNILSGEISKTVRPKAPMPDSSAYIESIIPSVDNKYTYTWL